MARLGTRSTLGIARRLLLSQGGAPLTFEQRILALNPVGLWYAGDGENVPAQMNSATDGGSVTTWSDLGSEGNDVSQSTPSARPTYDLSNPAFNNRGCVTFAAANSQYLGCTLSASVLGSLTTFNVIAVFVGDTPAAEAMFWSEGNSLTNSYNRLGYANPTGGINGRQLGGTGVLMTGGTGADDGNIHVAVMRRISTNSYELRLDGVQVDTDSGNAGGDMDRLAIGANLRATAALFLNGSIALAAVFDTDVYAQAEALIAEHYGMTLP